MGSLGHVSSLRYIACPPSIGNALRPRDAKVRRVRCVPNRQGASICSISRRCSLMLSPRGMGRGVHGGGSTPGPGAAQLRRGRLGLGDTDRQPANHYRQHVRRPQIHPGRLVEQPSPSGVGVERTTFGEFIGPRGELASYALGWATDNAELIGQLTIGIGVGNPGGGTFHAVIAANGDSYGMALADEAFAQVPQGGPDLSRDQALAHVDLPFVWAVADEVMARDPQAWRFRHWVLQTSGAGTAGVLAKAEPVLHLQHDADGTWQALGATGTSAADGSLHLWHLVEEDPTLMPVLDLAPGEAAWRRDTSSPWQRDDPKKKPRRRFGRRKG